MAVIPPPRALRGNMDVMTLPTPRFLWRPSYVRRAPRWHDGVGRLLDLGATFDLRLPVDTDADKLNEDLLMIRQDMQQAVEELRAARAALPPK